MGGENLVCGTMDEKTYDKIVAEHNKNKMICERCKKEIDPKSTYATWEEKRYHYPYCFYARYVYKIEKKV